jgi:hypothetical protein
MESVGLVDCWLVMEFILFCLNSDAYRAVLRLNDHTHSDYP